MSRRSTTRRNVYDVITARILAALEKGTVPWHQPWTSQPPTNLVSKKPYRGVNVFVLGCSCYGSPWWATYRQVQVLGGHVCRGERGSPVCFWKWIDKTEDDAPDDEARDHLQPQQIPLLRYYTVFNAEQCRGISRHLPPAPSTPAEPITAAEQIVGEMPNPPRIQHRSMQAAYHPPLDLVTIPALADFEEAEAYYTTLFHELAHSTGHSKRLNRPTLADACPFGTTNYSKEELTAEMAAAFLCGHAGIENRTIDSSASYIANWWNRLSQDRKLFIRAASAAQKAADFILGSTDSSPDSSDQFTKGGSYVT